MVLHLFLLEPIQIRKYHGLLILISVVVVPHMMAFNVHYHALLDFPKLVQYIVKMVTGLIVLHVLIKIISTIVTLVAIAAVMVLLPILIDKMDVIALVILDT